MKRIQKHLVATAGVILFATGLFPQSGQISFSTLSGVSYPAPYSAYTARFDAQHRPYIYTANKEYGVIVFDFSDPADLKPVKIFSAQQFQNLKPTDLVQQGDYLYVSLGEFAGLFTQNAGLAVIDVSDPVNAVKTGQWSGASFDKGCAALCVDGDFAYLGAMEKGVIVVDISNPSGPQYLSHVELDLNWPVPPGVFSVPHARGLALRDNDLWVCFDAGGLRRVDVSDKQNLMEVTKYINEALDAVAQPAYNTAAIAGDYLYAAVDYCGLDVVDISNPDQPYSYAWINPWDCNNFNWDGRPGHTNQVVTARHDSLLFISGADSEVLAYSIATPGQPAPIGQYAQIQDSAVTWGLDANDSLVVLALVWNPLNTPYIAKKGGIRLMKWNFTTGTPNVAESTLSVKILPNPVGRIAQLVIRLQEASELRWTLTDLVGRPVSSRNLGKKPAGEYREEVNFDDIAAGSYVLTVWANEKRSSTFVLKIQ